MLLWISSRKYSFQLLTPITDSREVPIMCSAMRLKMVMVPWASVATIPSKELRMTRLWRSSDLASASRDSRTEEIMCLKASASCVISSPRWVR